MSFRLFRSKKKNAANVQSIRSVILDRPQLLDSEFIERAALPSDLLTAAIVSLIRKRLSEVSHLPVGSIWPDDAFDGDFGRLQEWPEFDKSVDLSVITQQFGLKLNPSRLERVIDPSSPRRRGSVSHLIRDLRGALIVEDYKEPT